MELYPSDIFEKLEFNKILQAVSSECLGEEGKEYFSKINISTDEAEIERLLNEVAEWKLTFSKGDSIPMAHYEPIGEDLALLSKQDYVLDVEAIQRIHQSINSAVAIAAFFDHPLHKKQYTWLYDIACGIQIDSELSKEIRRVFDDEGEVRPDASPALLKISRSISNREKEMLKAFNLEVLANKKLGFLAENLESMRNGRRVLTVNAEHKRKIPGVIHDESGTGKMVYIEPASTVAVNNEIASLHHERRTEIYKIVKELCRSLRPHIPSLKVAHAVITKLDTVRAKAKLAAALNAHRPKLIGKPKIHFNQAYNPVLLLKSAKSEHPVVPHQIVLDKKNRLLILSGPNAGGKSVALKSVGVLQLMVQSGFLIPAAEDSRVGIFQKIFVDIGDQQSLEDDLSTYSSHLTNMKRIIDHTDKRSLVLIDEFGSGTDPKIGGAIAEAILHKINQCGSYGLITTHYPNLKYYAYKMAGVVNGSMEFDKQHLQPTFHLQIGRPGSSFAYEIAEKIGLDAAVLSNARKKTGKNVNALEDILVDLQVEKKELEAKMARILDKEERLEKLMANYTELHKELEYQRKKMKLEKKEAHLYQVSNESKELQKLIKELKQNQDVRKAEQAIKAQKKREQNIVEDISDLKEVVFEKANVSKKDLVEGKFVRLRNSSSVGKIIAVEKDRIQLEMGFLKVFADIKDVLPANEPIEINRKKSIDTSQVSGLGGQVETKLDLRGYKVDDAMWFLEEFIERAIMNNAFELKVIHGIGNGILKKHVHKKLAEYKEVKEVWHPEEEYGGQSVTLIKL